MNQFIEVMRSNIQIVSSQLFLNFCRYLLSLASKTCSDITGRTKCCGLLNLVVTFFFL